MFNYMNIIKMDQYTIKIYLLGDSAVGKTSIINTYCDNNYSESETITCGIDYKIKKFVINDKNVRLVLWDTPSQEKFRTVISNFYCQAHAIILVFDLTNRNTFVQLYKWIEEINHHMDKDDYKIIIMGNKLDNMPEHNFTFSEITNLMDQYKINHYYVVSAKNNTNIDYHLRI